MKTIVPISLFALAVFAQTPNVVGVVNPVPGIGFTPGMRVWIAGTNFGRAPAIAVGGRSAPILQTSGWFYNSLLIGDAVYLQIPVDLTAGPTTLEVTSDGVSSAPLNLTLDQYNPGLLHGPANTSGRYESIPRVLPDGSFAPWSCSPGQTPKPGDIHAAFAIGLGPTDPAVPTGKAAPASPLAQMLAKPRITVGDQTAEVLESVLAPGELGVYRVTFKVPPVGDGLQNVNVSLDGKTSNPMPLSVGKAVYYDPGAPESIGYASVCGNSFTSPGTFAQGDARNPPTTLSGISVKVKDSAGVDRLAQLLSVSANSVQYIVPAGTATGTATATITSSDDSASVGPIDVQNVAPVLSAAFVVRLRDGVQAVEPLFDPDAWYPTLAPIALGPESDQVFLVLFGTGLRHRSSLTNVSVMIDGVVAPVEYAGPQGEYAGMDQLNVRLPRPLAGRGLVQWAATVDGKIASIRGADLSGNLLFREQ